MALFNTAAVCGRTAIFASGSEPSVLTVKNSTALRLPVTVRNRELYALKHSRQQPTQLSTDSVSKLLSRSNSISP